MLCKIWSCYDNATISTGGAKPNHYHSNNCRRRPRMDSAFKPGPPYPYGKRLRSRVSLEFRSGDAGLTRLFSNSSSLVCFRSPWARSAPVQGKSNTHSRPSPQAKPTPSPSFTGNCFCAPADSNTPLLTASRAQSGEQDGPGRHRRPRQRPRHHRLRPPRAVCSTSLRGARPPDPGPGCPAPVRCTRAAQTGGVAGLDSPTAAARTRRRRPHARTQLVKRPLVPTGQKTGRPERPKGGSTALVKTTE